MHTEEMQTLNWDYGSSLLFTDDISPYIKPDLLALGLYNAYQLCSACALAN